MGLGFTIETRGEASEFKVSVDAILPQNQITQGVKHFDLKMKPNEEQTIFIQLTNHTSEKVDLKTVYSDAKTTSLGVIEYSANKELQMKAPSELLFTNVIDGPKNVSLKAKEVKQIEFILKMPAVEFDGFIAGGVEFIQEVEQAKDNSSLRAQRSYLVGFKLSETDKELPIDLTLDQTVVGTKNYKNALLIGLANQNSHFIEELTIQGTISKKGDSTILLETNMDSVRIAPYSILEIPIYLNEMLLDTGDYNLTLKVKDKKEYSKEWHQEFKVTKKDVELLKENQKLLGNVQHKSYLWVVLLVIVGMTTIAIIVWFNKDTLLKKIKVKGKKNVKK